MVERCVHNLVAANKENKGNHNLKLCHICLPLQVRKKYVPKKIRATKDKEGGIKHLDKFIFGVVRKFIYTYAMKDFVVQKGGDRRYSATVSDYQNDLKNVAYVAVLTSQKNQPEKSKEPSYLKTTIINALIAAEQDSRQRRDKTDNVIDEPGSLMIEAKDQFAASEARQDVQRLISKAKLSDSEQLCLELKWGIDRGEPFGPCKVARIACLTGRSENWVRSRLTAVEIKLVVATEP